VYIGYNIPFGRSFVTAKADCTCGTTCQNGTGSNGDCNWEKSDRYEQDWGVVSKADSPIPVIGMTENSNDLIKVEVSFSGTTIKKTITITAAGDANVE